MTHMPEAKLARQAEMRHTTVAMAPDRADVVLGIYEGIGECARAAGVYVVGGDTVRTTGPLALTVALYGEVHPDRLLRRAGAKPGDVVALDARNCLVRSDGARIAVAGVSDLIVVASGNDILILPRGRSQDVKLLLEAMKG